MARLLSISMLIVGCTINLTQANPVSEIVKAGGRTVIRKAGGAVVRQGGKEVAKQAAKRAVSNATRHSVKSAARSRAAQTLRAFGDDAVRVGGRVSSKATSFADDVAKVSKSLSPQNHRRLMMLAPSLKRTGQSAKAMRELAQSTAADKFVEFLWDHRGKLLTAATATTLIANADHIAEAGTNLVAKPLIEQSVKSVVEPVGQIVGWCLTVAGTVLFVVVLARLATLIAGIRWLTSTVLTSLRPCSTHESAAETTSNL